VTVVFGAIAPHGDPAFDEGSRTRLAFEELGRRLERAAPDVTVVVTPHNVHVEGAFAVVTAATIAGSLEELPIELECTVDRDLAAGVLAALRDNGLPAVRMSYGSNDESLAVMPMDWGTLIPLWFLGGQDDEPRPVVVVSPARDRSLADHVKAGEAIAKACAGRVPPSSRAPITGMRTIPTGRSASTRPRRSTTNASSSSSARTGSVMRIGMICASFEPS
jgi:aromatic ring-opening dioxygenase LigB subunit